MHIMIRGWISNKYVLFAALLTVCTTLIVVFYYTNHPGAEPQADTWSYLYVVNHTQTRGQLANFWRLPGYPLFIMCIYTLVGQGNLAAVSIAQAVLFILSTLELYVLALLILRRAWVALLIALLFGVNIPLLSYTKPIMSEALALWLFLSLVLAIMLFLSKPCVGALWLVTLCAFLLIFTRPEWIYLPVPLFAYLLLMAVRKSAARRLLLHMIASLAFLYATIGGYIYLNATQNHFIGLTWIENINGLGKVLQYHMQDEAPAQYAGIRRILDSYVAHDILDPYAILSHEPLLSRDYAAPASQFAQTIITHHPGEFVFKSVPVFFSSLTDYHQESRIAPNGPFGPFLTWIQDRFHTLYQWNILFLPCAMTWLFLLCWRRTRQLDAVQKMSTVLLLSFYGLIVTCFGAYRGGDYMRIHILFDPLLILVTWGTVAMGVMLAIKYLQERTKSPFRSKVKEDEENVPI